MVYKSKGRNAKEEKYGRENKNRLGKKLPLEWKNFYVQKLKIDGNEK